jgi:hypothetical protein
MRIYWCLPSATDKQEQARYMRTRVRILFCHLFLIPKNPLIIFRIWRRIRQDVWRESLEIWMVAFFSITIPVHTSNIFPGALLSFESIFDEI